MADYEISQDQDGLEVWQRTVQKTETVNVVLGTLEAEYCLARDRAQRLIVQCNRLREEMIKLNSDCPGLDLPVPAIAVDPWEVEEQVLEEI
jgi:hypothetical protein